MVQFGFCGRIGRIAKEKEIDGGKEKGGTGDLVSEEVDLSAKEE